MHTIPKCILVGLTPPHQSPEKTLANFEELQSLVDTYGGTVVAATTQNFSKANSRTYIGEGKVGSIAATIKNEQADIVIINDTIKADQLFNLTTIFAEVNPAIKVWDRVDLILNIFKKHATTAEAKLQIELADTQHKGPQLQGMGMGMSQQGGGIGTRGMGETGTEVIKRHYKKQIEHIEQELDKTTRNRQLEMDNRKRLGLPTISLVGYTNAGKSTLFNLLSKKKALVRNALFATLDSSVGKFFLPTLNKEVFVTDTIGFIQNLPPELIKAFTTTLLETVHADLLLHVIDASDPWMADKIKAVEEILINLGIGESNQIYVFNKIDLAKNINIPLLSETYAKFNPQFISAQTGGGLNSLINSISANLPSNL